MPAALQRYVAFLRGVSPLNAKMRELQRAFEAAGFVDVRTVLGSGNVLFSAPRASLTALAKRCERAMSRQLGSSFFSLVRPVDELARLLDSRPFARFRLKAGDKRIVTFLAQPPTSPSPRPQTPAGFRILAQSGDIVLSSHTPGGPHGSALMAELERRFGKSITSRSVETVAKCVKAAPQALATEPKTRRRGRR